ncbi:MAG TPA: ATP-binding protein, partial [Chloroflexota bacterium]|nr:ATP-binding protein [Chloroflexota bacterium]
SISGLRTQVVERGLAATLREYAAEFGERHDIEVVLDLDEMPPVPPLVAFHLFRVAQEALANVRKHAHCRHAWLAIRCSAPAGLTLSVADDGHGFDPGTGASANEGAGRRGFGLETMRERADALGGSLHIDSRPGEGTRVSVSVPVQRTP